jgi:hypothetical protein
MQTHFVPPASIPANKSVMAISVYRLRGGESCSHDYIHYILLNQDLLKSPPLDETDSGRGWWRTRPDPFSKVWAEVEQELGISPSADAKALFMDLQQQYPGKFPDGQLRTFQRRVKVWRVEQANDRIEGETTAKTLSSIPGNGDSG